MLLLDMALSAHQSELNDMKPTATNSTRSRSSSRTSRPTANPAGELFLGSKMIGELRILMRLSSPNASGGDPLKQSPLKSF